MIGTTTREKDDSNTIDINDWFVPANIVAFVTFACLIDKTNYIILKLKKREVGDSWIRIKEGGAGEREAGKTINIKDWFVAANIVAYSMFNCMGGKD